jgi:hypothetical protein
VGSDVVPTVIATRKIIKKKKIDSDDHKFKFDAYIPASSKHSTAEEFNSND